jgi:hypothetical protein
MRIQSSKTPILLSALTASFATALTFDCAQIKVNDYKYDLSALGGVHEIYHLNKTEAYSTNTTYVLDICSPLGKASKRPNGAGSCEYSKNSTSHPLTRAQAQLSLPIRHRLTNPSSA